MRWIWATLLILAAPAAAQSAASLDGDWDGALAVGSGVKLRLSLHVENLDGIITAILISTDQGNAHIPVASAVRDGDTVSLDVPAVHGGFKGTLSGDTLAGTWTQGAAMPLTFTRRAASAPAPAAFRRPQEPQPPFPYDSKDVVFPGPGGIQLAGTLTMPKGPGPFAALVLVQGSGPHDRDETIMGHKPFLLLADTLTRRGIAVLRADKRGIGKSTGRYATATSEDFAADTEAAIAWLRAQKTINPDKIGMIGHSEGGLIAPMVAAKDSKVAFIVLMAGPGLPGANIMTMQHHLIDQAMGAQPAALEKADAFNRQVIETTKTAKDSDDAKAKVQALMEARGMPADRAAAAAAANTTPWFRFFLNYDPVPTLKQVRCPVLAIDGSLDLQVPPKEDLAAIQAALAGDRDVTVKELPGLNHLFQTAKTGAPGEYAQIEETIAPAALAVIGDWIVQRVR